MLIALCLAVSSRKFVESSRLQALIQLGNSGGCPLASSAHAIRAFFAAIATTASCYPQRCRTLIAQRERRSSCRGAVCSTERAPMMKSVRR